MSSLAAAAANPYSTDSLKILAEEQLTNCLRRKEHDILDADTRKKVLSAIERVRIDNWQNGIFMIDFNGRGANRYHHLSEENRKAWDSIKRGTISPVDVENIANDILSRLGEKMQIFTTNQIPLPVLPKLLNLIQTSTFCKSLVACSVRQIYSIDNGKGMVIVFSGTPTEQQKYQLNTLIFGSDAALQTQFSHQLQEFALLFEINIENGDLRPFLASENREKAIQLHQTLHAQMNTPSYANIAQEWCQKLSARITLEDGCQYGIPLSEFLLPLLQLPQLPFS